MCLETDTSFALFVFEQSVLGVRLRWLVFGQFN